MLIQKHSGNSMVSGIYLAVDYHPNTDFILDKIAKELGIIPDNGRDPSGNDREYVYHTTIIYSKFKVPRPETDRLCNFETKVGSTIFKMKRPKLSVPVKIVGFGFFDTPNGRNFHVRVDSPFLRSEFKRAVDYGLPTDFPQYIPHISIKNDVPKDFKVPNEIAKKYIGTILYTNDEYIERLSKPL